ncbi:MAG TPA: 3'-5' exonuclease, partial [Acidimicrobiales bacterium]|nr:3'-5' exonuclease [Acidimicrobiales bacterium]
MELTEGQRRAVDHDPGVLQVVGAAGAGKTTALTARYLRLVREHRPSSVVVLCRSRGAALRFRDAVLPGLAGGFDSLPITTFAGLAFDLVTRRDGPVRLVTDAEQRRTVARLLGDEDKSAWPTLGHLLGRRALVADVADALLVLQQRGPDAAADPAWDELRRFLPRYRQALADLGGLDVAGLLGRAADLLADGAGDRFGHVLVDDCDAAGPASDRILRALTSAAAGGLVVAGDCHGVDAAVVVDLGNVSFRRPEPPVLVTCRHPSLEVEAIAAELLAARDRGVGWSDMAVLLRHPARRSRRLSRALARHGIPAAVAAPLTARDDPVVASVVDMLRWVDGDTTALDRLVVSPLSRLDPLEARRMRRTARAEETRLETDPRLAPLLALRDRLAARAAVDPPAELAFEIWHDGLAHLVADDGGSDSLDALVGFLDALNRDAERDPDARLGDVLAAIDLAGSEIDPYRIGAASPTDAVSVTSIHGAAGREWHTVVLAGCVEGELPSIRAREPLFDPAVLDGEKRPTSAERRREALAEERRLFGLARTRATGRLVGVAAPEPGVLLSRFVEAWPLVPAGVVVPPDDAPAPLEPTRNRIPVVSGTGLMLSATQLDTYDDCPLRYAYRYVVRVRDEGGVRADLGSLVHDVLRRFLD